MRKLLTCLVGMLLFLQAVNSQMLEISGKILDDRGNPVPGGSIQEKSTRRGTTSDANGLFKLTTDSGATLIFSSVGFDKKELVLDNAGFIVVKMVATNQAL